MCGKIGLRLSHAEQLRIHVGTVPAEVLVQRILAATLLLYDRRITRARFLWRLGWLLRWLPRCWLGPRLRRRRAACARLGRCRLGDRDPRRRRLHSGLPVARYYSVARNRRVVPAGGHCTARICDCRGGVAVCDRLGRAPRARAPAWTAHNVQGAELSV